MRLFIESNFELSDGDVADSNMLANGPRPPLTGLKKCKLERLIRKVTPLESKLANVRAIPLEDD